MGKFHIGRFLTMLPVAGLLQTFSLSEAAAAPVTPQGTSQRERYTDGDYTATGKYGGQPSFITVTIRLRQGIITQVSVKPHAYVTRSLQLQRAFASAVPKVVVGKPIEQVKVCKLAGSSGTPKGFNDAIRQIREQAKQ